MRRPEKLAEMIREEIIQIVGFELDDPRVASVAVTGVRVTDNLRDARVFITVEGSDDEKREALAALRKAAPYVRRQLGTTLNLRYTPELHFVRDTVEEAASRVEELLAGIKRDEPPAADAAPEETAEGEKSVASDE